MWRNSSHYGLNTCSLLRTYLYLNDTVIKKKKKNSCYLNPNTCLQLYITHNNWLDPPNPQSWCLSTADYLYALILSQIEVTGNDIPVAMKIVFIWQSNKMFKKKKVISVHLPIDIKFGKFGIKMKRLCRYIGKQIKSWALFSPLSWTLFKYNFFPVFFFFL